MDISEVGQNLLQILQENATTLSPEDIIELETQIQNYDTIAGMDYYVRTFATQIGAQVPLDTDSDIALQWTLVDLMTTDLTGLPSISEIIRMPPVEFQTWFPESPDYDTRIQLFLEMAQPELETPGVEVQPEVQEPGTYAA
jgi:hypothetical protein